ncbi:hypothetical protein [Peribacillus glennii]|uniref:CPBP family intramembrane metalloprotease n=1 Tax=Peribacillus glennii TaxID=2303991 RepID=A0A372LA47_9BACI|nr:hypothetical protein [Peribacillus glennii]RFU62089.1 hypothetical protein D0466_16025 [Peribacillus glennii]
MGKLLSFSLELIRIVVLGVILLIGLAVLEQYIYEMFGIQNISWGYVQAANLILFFLIYRSKWQFSGWFKSRKNTNPLPQGLVKGLMIISILLLIAAAV